MTELLAIQGRDKKAIDPELYTSWMAKQVSRRPCDCLGCRDHSRELREQFGIPADEGAGR